MSDEIRISKRTLMWIGLVGSLASIVGLALVLFGSDPTPNQVTTEESYNVTEGNRVAGDNISGNQIGKIGRIEGDVTFQTESEPEFEFVSEHDGAGAPILTAPSVRLYIRAAMEPTPELLGRLDDGTGLRILEKVDTDVDGNVAPFAKVEVLEGDMKGTVGWTPRGFVKKPR